MRIENIKKGTVAYVNRYVLFSPIETAKAIAKGSIKAGWIKTNTYTNWNYGGPGYWRKYKPDFSHQTDLLSDGVMSVCIGKNDRDSTVWLVADPKHQRFGEAFVISYGNYLDNHRKIFLDPPCVC
jgi:hypothetical protein